MSNLYENLLEYFNLPLKTISIFCVFSDYFQIPVKLYFVLKWEFGVKSCLIYTWPPRSFCTFQKSCFLDHHLLSPSPPALCPVVSAASSPTQTLWAHPQPVLPCAKLCPTSDIINVELPLLIHHSAPTSSSCPTLSGLPLFLTGIEHWLP